ncbi:MAG: putative manganese-dependent inorganic diphosphatase [Bacilli bacterium]|nr:putative manganese-dependent inorganic diphosphatase [Bacilli bacterium]
MEKTLIFGHRKPDTDSVCSAIALSYLKNAIGESTEPRILSDMNNETKFVLDYFKVKRPKYLNDVKLQIKDVNYLKNYYNYEKDSIHKGYMTMTNNDTSTTLIVDKDKKFRGIVGMKDIAKDQISGNLHHLIASYDNILKVLEGEEVLRFEEEVEGNIIAASYKSTRIIESVKMDKDTVLIIGDRHSVIEYAVESGIKLLILTGNSSIKKEHLEIARKNKVNIIRTNFDSFHVTKVINLCNYIYTIIRKTSISCMLETDYVTDFVDHANRTKFSYYPVVDKNQVCKGIIRLNNLGEKTKKKVILVDHNSYDQSVEGLDEAEIVEIIDHHNIGSIGTSMPINFRNMPVGSTNTIVYMLYKENKIEITKEMAGMMLSGILSDTLILKSPTTTPVDRTIVEDLARIADVDYQKYGMEMFNAGTSLKGRTKEEIIYTDFKLFPVDDRKMGIGQVFTTNVKEITDEQNEYLELLESITLNNNYALCVLAVTDIINNGSYLFFNEKAKRILENAFAVENMEQGYYLPDVVSRKKQILPNIMSALD